MGNKKGQSREACNIWIPKTQGEDKQSKKHNIMRKQTYIMQILHEPPTNNWRQRQTQHRFHAEIVKGITR